MRRAPALGTPPGLDHCLALLRYEGAGRELVARLKYRNRRVALEWLVEGMAALLDPALASVVDVVTWAPATPDHVRRRGFDHGRLLARAVARRLDRPCTTLLTRTSGPGLTGRGAADRRGAGLGLTSSRRVDGGTVLLVDDVVTTGTTMTAAARTLRSAGAAFVFGLAAARTPPPGPGPGA
jgi:predicted amidophosphoribosyltransferase